MNETWMDADTKLEWAVNKSNTPLGYNEIDNYIKKLNDEQYAGHKDWRCPEIKELISLIDFNRAGPAMKTEVTFRDDEGYWSGTPSAKSENMAWFVDFHFGYIHFNTKDNKFLVRAVRTGN